MAKENENFDEFEEKQELTEADLQAQLAAYQAAIRAEYEVQSSEAQTPREMEEITGDFFRRNASSAAAQIVWLSQNSSSDSVRLAAAKYVIDRGFKEQAESGDPIKEIIAGLQANDKKPQPDHE